MFLKKLWYKITNRKKYQLFKDELNIKNSTKIFKQNYEHKIRKIQSKIQSKNELSFLHSGHCGDIINALPVIKELSKNHKCNLYINNNKLLEKAYSRHPANNVYINDRIFDILQPLLKSQKYINKIDSYNSEEIDINLDLFRELPINILFDNLKYYSLLTGIQPDINAPYLDVPKHDKIVNKIVIQRTFRYRNQFINYKFLNNYHDIYFIGTNSEYQDMKKEVTNLKFYECKDFLEMAKIINSSKFFIGNSSVGFPIAEALKAPRLLEACPYFPAAQTHGKNAYDFYFQDHFEKFFKILNK